MFRDRPGLGLSLGKAKADEDPYVGRGGNENAIACACEAQLQVSLAFGVLSSSFETGPYTGILGSRRGVVGPMSSKRYRFTHLTPSCRLTTCGYYQAVLLYWTQFTSHRQLFVSHTASRIQHVFFPVCLCCACRAQYLEQHSRADKYRR